MLLTVDIWFIVRTAVSSSDIPATVNQNKGTCPVCRKVFDAKDIEHVLGYLETNLSELVWVHFLLYLCDLLFFDGNTFIGFHRI